MSNTLKKLPLFTLIALTLSFSFNQEAKSASYKRYDKSKDKIISRKSLDDAYQRFGKIYDPYDAQASNLEQKEAKQIERLFYLTDLAVIEKVLLLEFIGKVHEGEVERNAPHKDYYSEIISEIEKLEVSGRMIKIKKDVLTAIAFHIEVLKDWLAAARKNEVHKVKNKSGRWVHSGTSAGDKIFYALYHQYIVSNFKDENKEGLDALSRHLCVLVF